MPLWVILLGVGGVAWWLLQQSSSAPIPPQSGYGGPVATSPVLSYAASYMPNPNAPVVNAGLPTGWYWQDQQNTAMIVIGDPIRAVVMGPDDVATAVYGSAVSALGPITMQVSQPAAGLASGQQVTLPSSYVTSDSMGV